LLATRLFCLSPPCFNSFFDSLTHPASFGLFFIACKGTSDISRSPFAGLCRFFRFLFRRHFSSFFLPGHQLPFSLKRPFFFSCPQAEQCKYELAPKALCSSGSFFFLPLLFVLNILLGFALGRLSQYSFLFLPVSQELAVICAGSLHVSTPPSVPLPSVSILFVCP